MNIKHIQNFRNAVRRDASAQRNVKLFFVEPLIKKVHRSRFIGSKYENFGILHFEIKVVDTFGAKNCKL
ncbi:MAG: hypothetical protein U9R02_00305 [Thermodesulfobacteriota bacterium]|nr:hypothetical protein [Thermodesulfobacteriota bacterium]